jgi:hypothetical protein
MRKAFDWKRSRISVLEVEAVHETFIPQVQIGLSVALYMRSEWQFILDTEASGRVPIHSGALLTFTSMARGNRQIPPVQQRLWLLLTQGEPEDSVDGSYIERRDSETLERRR